MKSKILACLLAALACVTVETQVSIQTPLPADIGGLYTQKCGTISAVSAAVATGANTTPTDGISYTIPANTLIQTGRGFHLVVFGKTGATANVKTVAITFGADSFTIFSGAVNANDWFGEYWVMRTGASTQWRGARGGFSTTNSTTSVTTVAATETATIAFKVTMTNGTAAASDITTTGGYIECF